MRTIFLGLIIGAVAFAQTTPPPVSKSTAARSTATKSTAAKTTASRGSVIALDPETGKVKALHTPAKRTSPVASAAKAPAAKGNLLQPATLNAKAPAEFSVRMNTSKGPVTIQVTRAWAPLGADRFYNLVRAGFFTDMYFFRVIPNFMAQFGMSSNPEISKAWFQATITDDPVVQSNKRGMVTFAKTGAPNSRSTQFFINFGDNSQLDRQGFAPFGQVVEGMDVVDQLYSGYAEASNNQDAIRSQGKAFFAANYPKLDKIVTATIIPAASAASDPRRSSGRPSRLLVAGYQARARTDRWQGSI